MPTYQYACTECGEPLEMVQAFTDAPLTECPACGGRLRKVFSAVGVVFKGSGFYKTDSRKGADSTASKSSGSDSGSGKGSSPKESTKESTAAPAASGSSTSGSKSSGTSASDKSSGSSSGAVSRVAS